MLYIYDTIMYANYYKKVFYLSFLKKFRKIDYTGRIENKDIKLRGYEGCYPVHRILQILEPKKSDKILDIGCGKGLFLYYASKFDFGRIDGIEYSKELNDIAIDNLTIINDKRISIINCDARNFNGYDKYDYFFINNPFTAEVMEIVVKAICDSYKKKKRRIIVIYQFPFNIDIFLSYGFEKMYEKYPNCILTFG